MLQGGKIVLTDEKGGTSTVTIADMYSPMALFTLSIQY